MAYTRRTVIAGGGALLLGGVAGCQSVIPSSSASEKAGIQINNKTEKEETITLAVSEGAEKAPDEYLWKNKFSLGPGETRNARPDGSNTESHEVPANATYMIEVRLDEDGPTSTSVFEWQDATGTFVIDIYQNRIKGRTEKD